MITALLPFAGQLLDKFFLNAEDKAAAQMKLTELAQSGELAKMANDTRLIELGYQDTQASHKTQADVIQSGDNAPDEYVRHTRPLMARQSWYAGALYCIAFEGAKLYGMGTGASMEIALTVLAPALAYMGFRTADKFAGGKK